MSEWKFLGYLLCAWDCGDAFTNSSLIEFSQRTLILEPAVPL